MKLTALLPLAALAVIPALAFALPAERFTPSDLDAVGVSAPVEVMVLGTPHLSGAPDTFTPDMLEPVLAELEAFAPTHIAIEAVPAEHARFLMAEAVNYPGVADQFARTAGRFIEIAGETVQLSPAEADAAADEVLAGALNIETRREAVALLARAGDPHSALVNWLQLPEEARVPGGIVSPELADALARLGARRDESVALGVTLAARLGQPRVWGMDDWTAGDLFLSIVPELQAAIQSDPALSGVMDDPVMAEMNSAYARLTSPQDVLAVYRLFNDSEAQAARATAEWGAFLRAETAVEPARARVVAWEARNLRMAAHIIEATRGAPDARVLVIVGASHKPYLEAALDDLSLVEIVAFE